MILLSHSSSPILYELDFDPDGDVDFHIKKVYDKIGMGMSDDLKITAELLY